MCFKNKIFRRRRMKITTKNMLSDCFPQGMTAVPHGSRYIK
jgi:hypothetical protein